MGHDRAADPVHPVRPTVPDHARCAEAATRPRARPDRRVGEVVDHHAPADAPGPTRMEKLGDHAPAGASLRLRSTSDHIIGDHIAFWPQRANNH
jgi:hypothetical protein